MPPNEQQQDDNNKQALSNGAVALADETTRGVKPDEKKSDGGKSSGHEEFDVKHSILITYTILVGLGGIQAGFVVAGNNQTFPVIGTKMGWDEEQRVKYNTLISSCAIAGLGLGAGTGGKFMTGGRRMIMIVFNIINAVAVALTLFLNVPLICVGRFLFGYCSGVIQTVGVKMLDETVPHHLIGAYGTASNSCLSFGIMVAILLGLGLPENDDVEGQMDDEFWRVIYGFPLICQVVTILMLLTCFTDEPILYNIQKEDRKAAHGMVDRIYAAEIDRDKILDQLSVSTGKSAANVSACDAMCKPQYRKATWMGIILCFFQQQTALDGIMVYSNTIFNEMSKRGSIQFTPKQGSYIVGTLSLIVSLFASVVVAKFKRKTLLVIGQTVMATCLVLTGIAFWKEQDILTIVFICLFITGFQLSQGPIAWMYSAEICGDSGLGLCILSLYVSLLEKTITMEFMAHSELFGPHGMFIYVGAVTYIGSVFICMCIRETAGLTDQQKKDLYRDETAVAAAPDNDANEGIELGFKEGQEIAQGVNSRGADQHEMHSAEGIDQEEALGDLAPQKKNFSEPATSLKN